VQAKGKVLARDYSACEKTQNKTQNLCRGDWYLAVIKIVEGFRFDFQQPVSIIGLPVSSTVCI
jgi:hypothetical protein